MSAGIYPAHHTVGAIAAEVVFDAAGFGLHRDADFLGQRRICGFHAHLARGRHGAEADVMIRPQPGDATG